MENIELIVPDPKQKSGIISKIKGILKSIGQIITNFAEHSWKGAAIGALLAMFVHLMFIGSFFKTGISPVVDWFLILVLGGIIVVGTGILSKPLFGIIRKFNPWFVAALTSTLFLSQFMPLKVFGQNLILIELICGALAGFAISKGFRKPLSIVLILFTIIFNVLIIFSLGSDGTDSAKPVTDYFWNQLPMETGTPLTFSNDFLNVHTLYYGSGNDKHRKEFSDLVSIRTDPVDATPFFDQSSGFSNKMRELYWGFNSKNYPLNARVWYTKKDTLSPLVLIVHGNHNMYDYSDPGYEYLGKYLAEKGYIVASVDENFLNGGWMGDYGQSEVFTRAWLLLKHLELWREWSQKKESTFYKKVDMNNIALIGHSRGGAAAALASVINTLKKYHLNAKEEFNFGFNIKGVVQIAPNDPYNPQSDIPLTLENIDYLLLQGGYDQDMSWFLGNRVYNRLKFTDDQYHFKSAVYIYKANHGQFNSVWGRTDHRAPLSWFFNLKSIINEKDQQRITELHVLSFLDASLKKDTRNLPLLKDFRYYRSCLPKDYYINQFEDSEFRYIADYQEDFDVNTTTIKGCRAEGKNLKVWSENALSFRDDWNSSQYNCGVFLGWDKKDISLHGVSEYFIIADEKFTFNKPEIKNLFFFICNNNDENDSIDFTVEFFTKSSVIRIPFTELRILPPPLTSNLSKWPYVHSISGDNKSERILQLTEIPVEELSNRNKTFQISELRGIRFIFDRTDKGEIFLDKIGYN